MFKAYCYIRLPIFREKFLLSIEKKEDRDIQELKFTENKSEEFSKEMQESFVSKLDWETHFHGPLKNIPEFEVLNQELV